MDGPIKDIGPEIDTSTINISIFRSPNREHEGSFWRRNGYCISSDLFSTNSDDPTGRIVYDSIMDTFQVQEYNLENKQNKKEVKSQRHPTDWETLCLVEEGLGALTTPGFLSESDPREPHIRRLINVGKGIVSENAKQMLTRVANVEKATPLQRGS